MAAQDMAKTVRIDATVPSRRAAPVTRTRSSRARGRPSSEDAAAIDHELLDIALGLFLQHGYGGTSMRQIVAAAGVSKTTLYSRFTSKADLFRAIMIQQIDRLSPSASLQSEGGPLALEAGLRSYANQMLAVSLEGDVLGVNRLIYSESLARSNGDAAILSPAPGAFHRSSSGDQRRDALAVFCGGMIGSIRERRDP